MAWEEQKPLWDEASQTFAENASGDAHGFFSFARLSGTSIWLNIERGALANNNPQITNIIPHSL